VLGLPLTKLLKLVEDQDTALGKLAGQRLQGCYIREAAPDGVEQGLGRSGWNCLPINRVLLPKAKGESSPQERAFSCPGLAANSAAPIWSLWVIGQQALKLDGSA
jgi:hypothetical protein